MPGSGSLPVRAAWRWAATARARTLSAMLEDPGRYHWKWLAVGGALLVLYAIERTIRTGGIF